MLAQKKKKEEERQVLSSFLLPRLLCVAVTILFSFPDVSCTHNTRWNKFTTWTKKKVSNWRGVLHRPETKLFDGWEMGGEKKKSAANWLWARHPSLYKNIRKEQVYIHLSIWNGLSENVKIPFSAVRRQPPPPQRSEKKKKKERRRTSFYFILFSFFYLGNVFYTRFTFFSEKKKKKKEKKDPFILFFLTLQRSNYYRVHFINPSRHIPDSSCMYPPAGSERPNPGVHNMKNTNFYLSISNKRTSKPNDNDQQISKKKKKKI